MPDSVENRIAERKALADENLENQGVLGRASGRAGLAVANGVDRVTPPGSAAGIGAFLGGALNGIIQGAVLGLVAGVVLGALGVFSAAAVAAGAVYTTMEVGAALYGIYGGVKAAREQSANASGQSAADSIAERSGAVSSREANRARRRADQQAFIAEREEWQGPPHFVEDENRRRAHRHESGEHYRRL